MAERVYLNSSARGQAALRAITTDSFQNFQAQLGVGTRNVSTGSTYGFNPITRNRTLLEWAYRGSWVCGVAVDAVAEDMTRAGIEMMSSLPSSDIEKLDMGMQELCIWNKIQETIKWGRLYGGAIGVLVVEGQLCSTPLNPDRVAPGQFKGIVVFDRRMTTPSLEDIVTEPGPDAGMPRYYKIIQNAHAYPGQKAHYSRVVRIDGVELPFYQRITENLWSISILERLYDRLIAYDSASIGAAQLMYKAHIRTLSIEQLRELIAIGGKAFSAVMQNIEMIRQLQVNEGITLLDTKDKFETHSYQFSGIGDMLLQFAQQVAGALQIPLVRLLGQAPAGLNATGDSDFRNYYDGIKAQQEARLRRPMHSILKLLCRSVLGKPMPNDFSFEFTPLWQMSLMEKSELAARTTATIAQAFEAGIIDQVTALEELRANSRITGVWTSIGDNTIKKATLMPPPALPGEGENEPSKIGAGAGGTTPAPRGMLHPPSPPSMPSEAEEDDDNYAMEDLDTDETLPSDYDDGSDDMEGDFPTTEIDLHMGVSGEVDIIPS